jgi:hypothetical protein
MVEWTSDINWFICGVDFKIEPIDDEHYPAGISFESMDAERIKVLYCPNCGQKIQLED